jgi:hypothetical protein
MIKDHIRLLMIVLLLVIVMFSLFACLPSQSIELSQESFEEQSYPVSGSMSSVVDTTDDYGYPIDESQLDIEYYPENLEIPAPGQNTGVVTGRLLSINEEPYLAPALYLGKFINPSEPNADLPQVMSVTTATDPLAIQALDGTFLFTDVEPGQYGLLLWSPMNLIPVRDLNSTQDDNIIITVIAGEVTDLGDMLIE